MSIFVGHADAAVHLHAFLHRERRGKAGHAPWRPTTARRRRRSPSSSSLLRLEHRGARDFHFANRDARRGAAAPGTADRQAELLALLEIAERHVHRAAADAEHLGRERRRGRVEHARRAAASRRSTSPITASASTSTPSNVERARRCWHRPAGRRSALEPAAPCSTANSVMPSSRSALPAVRAATMIRSATWPSTTNCFLAAES